MKKFSLYLLITFLSVFTALSQTQAEESANISVQTPYAYATTSVQKNGAVFLTLINNGTENDKLILAHTDVADKTELHTHTMEGGMMQMREVDGYEVPAGYHITLEPMGHHIMMFGLHAPLKIGESFALNLEFEHHSPMSVDVKIVAPGTNPGQENNG